MRIDAKALWERILFGPGGRKAYAAGSVSFPTTDGKMIQRAFGNPSTSGKVVTESSAMGVMAHWSCIRLLAESLGQLPWSVYRKEKTGAVLAEDHWLQGLIAAKPNAEQTDVEFRECLGYGLAGHGNSYSMRETYGGRSASLYPLESGAVTPLRKQGSNTKLQIAEGVPFYRILDRGRSEDYPQEKVWHIKLFAPGRLVGLSPIAAARDSLGEALAMQEFSATFFAQGGAPAGTVSYPGWLSKEQRDAARQHLNELLGGLGKAHQFAMFEGGVKPEPWQGMSFEDVEFILGRKFSVLEVCRAHRVPPHLVYELDKASYASIEMQNIEYLTFSLAPYLKRLETSVWRWLMTDEDRADGYFVKFNANAILRTTTKERYDAHASAVQNGWKSRNEIRALEDLSTKPGLDDYTAQVNLVPVDDLGNQPAPPPPPAQDQPAKGQVNVVLPARHEEEKALREVLGTVAEAQRALADGVRELAAKTLGAVYAERREIAAMVAEANSKLASQVSSGTRKLAEDVRVNSEALAVRLDETGRRIADELKGVARQRRRIRVGGEEFLSEPADDDKGELR